MQEALAILYERVLTVSSSQMTAISKRISRFSCLVSPFFLAVLLSCAEETQPVSESFTRVRPSRIQEMEKRGDQFVRAGRYRDAVLAYTKASDGLSATAEVYRKLAEAHALNQELPEAVRVYKQAIAMRPDFSKARTELALLLTRLDRPEDARVQLDQAIRDRPDYAWAHMVLGLIHFRKGSYDEAIASHERAIAAVPDYAEAWFNLGEVYLKQNRYEPAELAMLRAVGIDSTVARFHNGLGRSYYLRREYEQAAKAFSHAVRIDSIFARARFNLGNSLLRMGEREEGRRQLELYKELEEQESLITTLLNTLMTYPDSAAVYHDLATVYSQRGQLSEAHARYLQAIQRDSTFAPSYHNLGNLYLRRGAFAQALALFERALRADATYALAHLAMGNTLMLNKQFDRALKHFHSGLRYEPNNVTLQRNLSVARDIIQSARRTQ